MASLSELLDTSTVGQPQLVPVATVEELLVPVVQTTEHRVVTRHETPERTVRKVLRGFVRLPFLLPEVLEKGCGGVLVRGEVGCVEGFFGRFSGFRIKDFHKDSSIFLFREVANFGIACKPEQTVFHTFRVCQINF